MSVNWSNGPLTLEELREEYVACVKILQAEKRMRFRVFSQAEPAKMVQEVGEIDRVLRLLETLKDVAKEHVPSQQPELFGEETEARRKD